MNERNYSKVPVFENGMAANMTEAQELVRTGKLQPTLSAFPELPPEESVEEENPADQEKMVNCKS